MYCRFLGHAGIASFLRAPSTPSFLMKKKNAEPFFKVGVNEMPVRPIHGDMSIGHANSGAGLLTLLRVGTIVTK